MSFISLPIGKRHKKPEKRRLKYIPAGYVESFYRILEDNIDNCIGSNFYGKIASDADIPSEDVQKYILATCDFAKGIQIDINHYVMKGWINNANFIQKLDPISKNVIRRQNPLELVFEDILTFDVENPIAGSLLKKLNVGEKDVANELIKKTPLPPGIDFAIQNRLHKLRNGKNQKTIITIYCLHNHLYLRYFYHCHLQHHFFKGHLHQIFHHCLHLWWWNVPSRRFLQPFDQQ